MYIKCTTKKKKTNKIPYQFIFIGQLKCQERVYKEKMK